MKAESSCMGLVSYQRDPRELSHPSATVGTEQEDSFLPARKQALTPQEESAGPLILDFLSSKTERNECQLFISHSVCGILLQQPGQTKIQILFQIHFWSSQR